MPRAAAPVEQELAPTFADVARKDDLCALLDAYRTALRDASRPHGFPALGTRRFVIEHIRRGTAALQREYCWRLADTGGDAEAESARGRLESFEASLPAAPSPLMPILLAIVVVIVAQLLGPLGAGVPGSDDLAKEVSEVQQFDVTQLGATVDVLVHASAQAVLFVFWAYAMAAAIVLWPFGRGYRAARALLRLDHPAANGTVAAEERSAFARFGASPPAERGFDLWPRACLLAAFAALAATFLLYVVKTDDEGPERVRDLVIAILIAVPVMWGVARIRREHDRRRVDASA